MNKYQEAFEKVKEACASFDTVDELITLKELVEKATPKKPTYVDIRPRWHSRYGFYDYTIDKCYKCPHCNSHIFHVWESDRYCSNCGGALDWSELDE